jgi:hypothetical protein
MEMIKPSKLSEIKGTVSDDASNWKSRSDGITKQG